MPRKGLPPLKSNRYAIRDRERYYHSPKEWKVKNLLKSIIKDHGNEGGTQGWDS